MDTKTKNLLDIADQKLENLHTELSNYSQDELTKQPHPNAWSAIQNIEHLRLAETMAMAYVKKKLSFNPTLKRVDFQSRMRSFILDSYMRAPIKINAPQAINSPNLSNEKNLKEVMEEWKKHRADTRAYFIGLDEEIFGLQVYKHPLSGRISLSSMVSFWSCHIDRHRKQINKGLK